MTFVLLSAGIVVQKQPYDQEGFIEAPDDVVCGWIYEDGQFHQPGSNDVNANILSAPLLGFGGPTGKEVFNGNR